MIETVTISRAAELAIGNLLAVIHSDGGHYQHEHGLEKAANDAIRVYYLKLHNQDIDEPFLSEAPHD